MWFVSDPVNQMQNRQVCHVSKHLWRPDASNRLSQVTWVFRITLRSSVSKHLRFGISTPCRNVSFASAIPNYDIVLVSKETLNKIIEPGACTTMNKFRVTGLVSSWQNQTTPIWLYWYHDADHQLSLSTKAWSWVCWARTHECVTSMANSQSQHRASVIHFSRESQRDSKLFC